MDVLERFRKLLAMTTSSVEEEARTAARMACKLILEHKLLVTLPTTGSTTRANEHIYTSTTVHFKPKAPPPNDNAHWGQKHAFQTYLWNRHKDAKPALGIRVILEIGDQYWLGQISGVTPGGHKIFFTRILPNGGHDYLEAHKLKSADKFYFQRYNRVYIGPVF